MRVGIIETRAETNKGDHQTEGPILNPLAAQQINGKNYREAAGDRCSRLCFLTEQAHITFAEALCSPSVLILVTPSAAGKTVQQREREIGHMDIVLSRIQVIRF